MISTSDNGSLVISTANGRVSVDISEELDGEWHHLVVSRSADRNELLVWIDFQPVATVDLGTGTLGRSSVEDVYSIIGARSLSDANAFRGLMDEIAFFDGMFTQSDVDALQAAMLIPEPASLMLLGLGSVLVLSRRRAA